jgi:hypothetical protein
MCIYYNALPRSLPPLLTASPLACGMQFHLGVPPGVALPLILNGPAPFRCISAYAGLFSATVPFFVGYLLRIWQHIRVALGGKDFHTSCFTESVFLSWTGCKPLGRESAFAANSCQASSSTSSHLILMVFPMAGP